MQHDCRWDEGAVISVTSTVECSTRTMQKGSNLAVQDLAPSPAAFTAVLEVDGTPSGEQLEVDISVLLLGANGKVRSDEDLVFYNQPVALSGAVRLREQVWVDEGARCEGTIALSLDDIPEDIARVVLTASLDPSLAVTFREVSGMRLRLQAEPAGLQLATYEVHPEGTELAIIFGEFYRREERWRFRAVGQGYADGLEAIAREFGVEVEPEIDEASDETASTEATSTAESGSLVIDDEEQQGPRPARAVRVRRARKPPQLPSISPAAPAASDAAYLPARLFPVAGIGRGEEQERRATSALLAVMSMVRPFGHDLLKPLGSPSGSVKTYVEVPFKVDGQTYRPDGLIVTRRGDRQWNCLVEVKTNGADLNDSQVGTYVQIARDEGFDAVLTVSNQVTGVFGDHPVSIDRRRLKRVQLHHLSWDEIHARAMLWLTHPPTGDPTAVRVVTEFVRYLEYEGSGLHGFIDMGPHWAKVRDAVHARTLASGSQGAADVCERFDQLMRHISLHLTRLLGVEVTSAVPRHTPDQASRMQQFADSGLLFGSLRVPGAVDTVVLRADLRAGRVRASIRLRAPREGRPRTKVNWALRQLDEARAATCVATRANGKATATGTLATVREDPECLIPDGDADIREFEVSLDLPMGTKRGVGRGTMITSAVEVIDAFYGEVVQHLRAARPA